MFCWKCPCGQSLLFILLFFSQYLSTNCDILRKSIFLNSLTILQITRYMILSMVTLCTGISLYERGRPKDAKEVNKSNTDDEEAATLVVKEKEETWPSGDLSEKHDAVAEMYEKSTLSFSSGLWVTPLLMFSAQKTGLRIRNKKCTSLIHLCNGIRSYSHASHLYRLMTMWRNNYVDTYCPLFRLLSEVLNIHEYVPKHQTDTNIPTDSFINKISDKQVRAHEQRRKLTHKFCKKNEQFWPKTLQRKLLLKRAIRREGTKHHKCQLFCTSCRSTECVDSSFVRKFLCKFLYQFSSCLAAKQLLDDPPAWGTSTKTF